MHWTQTAPFAQSHVQGECTRVGLVHRWIGLTPYAQELPDGCTHEIRSRSAMLLAHRAPCGRGRPDVNSVLDALIDEGAFLKE